MQFVFVPSSTSSVLESRCLSALSPWQILAGYYFSGRQSKYPQSFYQPSLYVSSEVHTTVCCTCIPHLPITTKFQISGVFLAFVRMNKLLFTCRPVLTLVNNIFHTFTLKSDYVTGCFLWLLWGWRWWIHTQSVLSESSISSWTWELTVFFWRQWKSVTNPHQIHSTVDTGFNRFASSPLAVGTLHPVSTW